ncbi:MAG: hypothetical protein GY953_53445 [bacterium]|nr:hypothetical protein [bacterium]
MTTLVKIAKGLLLAGVAALAICGVLLIVLLSWIASLDLDASGFQIG